MARYDKEKSEKGLLPKQGVHIDVHTMYCMGVSRTTLAEVHVVTLRGLASSRASTA